MALFLRTLSGISKFDLMVSLVDYKAFSIHYFFTVILFVMSRKVRVDLGIV